MELGIADVDNNVINVIIFPNHCFSTSRYLEPTKPLRRHGDTIQTAVGPGLPWLSTRSAPACKKTLYCGL